MVVLDLMGFGGRMLVLTVLVVVLVVVLVSVGGGGGWDDMGLDGGW